MTMDKRGHLTIRVTKELKEAAQLVASREGRTLTDVVLSFLRTYSSDVANQRLSDLEKRMSNVEKDVDELKNKK